MKPCRQLCPESAEAGAAKGVSIRKYRRCEANAARQFDGRHKRASQLAMAMAVLGAMERSDVTEAIAALVRDGPEQFALAA